LPLLIGSVLSIAIHVVALYGKGIHTPPEALQEQGRTVVRLTLLPAVASQAAAPEPQIEKSAEQPIEELVEVPTEVPAEPHVEQAFQPALPAKPVAESKPDPEPVAETEAVDSPDQDASLVEEKGVVAEAQPVNSISATYPRSSQRRGEEGTVLLSIEVLASGKAGKVKILKSSGYRRLDAAAVNAAKKTSYTPAMQFGRTVDSTLIQPLVFELTKND